MAQTKGFTVTRLNGDMWRAYPASSESIVALFMPGGASNRPPEHLRDRNAFLCRSTFISNPSAKHARRGNRSLDRKNQTYLFSRVSMICACSRAFSCEKSMSLRNFRSADRCSGGRRNELEEDGESLNWRVLSREYGKLPVPGIYFRAECWIDPVVGEIYCFEGIGPA